MKHCLDCYKVPIKQVTQYDTSNRGHTGKISKTVLMNRLCMFQSHPELLIISKELDIN